MSQQRTEMDQLQELVRLHRMGTGCREVVRLLAISPNTERHYREILAAEGLLARASRRAARAAGPEGGGR